GILENDNHYAMVLRLFGLWKRVYGYVFSESVEKMRSDVERLAPIAELIERDVFVSMPMPCLERGIRAVDAYLSGSSQVPTLRDYAWHMVLFTVFSEENIARADGTYTVPMILSLDVGVLIAVQQFIRDIIVCAIIVGCFEASPFVQHLAPADEFCIRVYDAVRSSNTPCGAISSVMGQIAAEIPEADMLAVYMDARPRFSEKDAAYRQFKQDIFRLWLNEDLDNASANAPPAFVVEHCRPWHGLVRNIVNNQVIAHHHTYKAYIVRTGVKWVGP
ncbi:MAG: hypothetical protein EB075_14310, partial [Bacteroidetes bacterium]|nr:hypothetical protein [Bacteroidota bacterium]